jgi:hypothetical protein
MHKPSASRGAGAFGLTEPFFTLCVEVASVRANATDDIIRRLSAFASDPPGRYILAQREAVNSRRERFLRGEYFRSHVLEGRRDEPIIEEEGDGAGETSVVDSSDGE